jgi:hypothetical protein
MVAALRIIVDNNVLAEGRREAKRSRVMLSAEMMTAAAKIPVIIRDISACGALITTPVSPPVGSYVTLRRGEVCVVAMVVWTEGPKVGLQFRERVDEASLLVVIGRPGTISAH